MKVEKDIFRLEHIQEAIEKISKIVESLYHFGEFEEKWLEQDAMLRNFEIIGEASAHISEEIKEKYSEIPWREIKGMRNFITHEYFGVDLESVWNAAITDLPILKIQILEILLELKKKQNEQL